MSVDTSEERVDRFLAERGLHCERPTKIERRKGKTPDFRVVNSQGLCFFCEVKAIVGDDWLGRELSQARPGHIVGGSRSDPVFNRLTDDIHTAVQQFDGVNPERVHPNVLAFVNYDHVCGLADVWAVLTGNFYADDGTVHAIYKQYSDGRVRRDKLRIDLYLWLDTDDEHHFLYSLVEPVHFSKLCTLLGEDPSRMQRVDA